MTRKRKIKRMRKKMIKKKKRKMMPRKKRKKRRKTRKKMLNQRLRHQSKIGKNLKMLSRKKLRML